jgi:hypothetical protein
MDWDDAGRPAGERSGEDLKRIARYQRWLVAVVLAQLALWVGFIALVGLGGMRNADRAMQFPSVLTLILGAVGAVFVFLVSWELRGAFAAVAFGGATLIPCVGLLVLAMVSGYATTELRKHGVKVGLFGASLDAIDERPDPYGDDDAGW